MRSSNAWFRWLPWRDARMAASDDPRIAPSLSDLIRLQHRARGFSFLHRQPVHSLLSGRRASRVRGRGLAFEEIRAYRPGDDIRLIDWRASARTGHTQTRVFTEERDRPTLLVVELSAAMFFGSAFATKSAIAAEVTALAAWRGLRGGDRIGALMFGEAGIAEVRPHRSRASVMRVLGEIADRAAALADAPPRASGAAALAEALRRVAAIVGHDWMVVVIADIESADREVAAILGRIARHNDVIAIPISDPLERALPAAPWRGTATDGSRTAVLDPRQEALGEKLPQRFAERLETIRSGGLRLGTPVLPIGTEEEAAPQLQRMLGAAAAPRRR
jgi:uncharacterized protein (DUF58 family)